MAKAVALHMLICDLDDQLRAQRFPRQVFALTPPALASRQAMIAIPIRVVSPVSPGMARECIAAIWLEMLNEGSAVVKFETGAYTDVLKRTRIIIKTQKE